MGSKIAARSAAIFFLKSTCLEGSDRSILMLSSCSSTIEGIKSPCSSLHMRGSHRWGVFEASNAFSVHQEIENQKMLRMKFWTSDFDVKKRPKRPRDSHNRIRLEKLCPKVILDRQNAGRMPSKRRFLYCCPIRENPALNVNFCPKPWGHSTPQSTIGFGQRILIRSIKWLGAPPILSWHKMGGCQSTATALTLESTRVSRLKRHLGLSQYNGGMERRFSVSN